MDRDEINLLNKNSYCHYKIQEEFWGTQRHCNLEGSCILWQHHPFTEQFISFLADGMCKSDKIWVACGANVVEILVVTFQSIACMVE